MGLAVVDMEVQRALQAQQPTCLLQPRLQKAEIVLEGIPVGGLRQQSGPVAAALEAGPLPRLVPHGREGASRASKRRC